MMIPCGYFKLLAQFDYFESGGVGVVDGECKVNPARYVELGGDKAGTLLDRVCPGHDALIRRHPGFVSSSDLNAGGAS